MLEDPLVEVRAAEVLDARRSADHAEGIVLLPEQGDVERAASEVVDGDRLAGLDLLLVQVVQAGRLRFAHQFDVAEPDSGQCRADQSEAVLAPRRGMGHRDDGGRLALVLLGAFDDPLCEHGVDVLGRDAQVAHDDRRLVADATLELAHDPIRLIDRPPLGRLADHDAAVVTEVHHGRHRGLARTEFERFDVHGAVGAPPTDGRSGVARADVDAQHE